MGTYDGIYIRFEADDLAMDILLGILYSIIMV